jgi:hypothetical protein
MFLMMEEFSPAFGVDVQFSTFYFFPSLSHTSCCSEGKKLLKCSTFTINIKHQASSNTEAAVAFSPSSPKHSSHTRQISAMQITEI